MTSMQNRRASRLLGWGAAGVVALTAATGIAEAATRTESAAPGAAAVAAGSAVSAAGAQAVPAVDRADGGGEADQGKAGQADKRRASAGKRWLHRPVHAELVVRGKDGKAGQAGFRTVLVQRGEVTGSTGSSVTVKSADGFTTTWQVGTDTRVRRQGAKVELAQVKAGDRVWVRGPKNDGGATARVLRAHPQKQAAAS